MSCNNRCNRCNNCRNYNRCDNWENNCDNGNNNCSCRCGNPFTNFCSNCFCRSSLNTNSLTNFNDFEI